MEPALGLASEEEAAEFDDLDEVLESPMMASDAPAGPEGGLTQTDLDFHPSKVAIVTHL
jgi:hypothetical protein